jgi:hypothetical protein
MRKSFLFSFTFTWNSNHLTSHKFKFNSNRVITWKLTWNLSKCKWNLHLKSSSETLLTKWNICRVLLSLLVIVCETSGNERDLLTQNKRDLESKSLNYGDTARTRAKLRFRELHSVENWTVIGAIAGSIIIFLTVVIYLINRKSRKYTNLRLTQQVVY